MENKIFSVKFDRETGGISELYIKADADKMNWVKPGKSFGAPTYTHNVKFYGKERDFRLRKFEERENGAVAEYYEQDNADGEKSVEKLSAKTEYTFDENGNLYVKTRIKNESRWQKFFPEGDIGVNINFYDDYYDANTCMTSRCTAHIWCGGDTTWVCALKMGESKSNIGLAFTEGGAVSYSQEGCKSNDRGYFIANLGVKTLRPGEEYTFSYVIFPHTGKRDFLRRLTEVSHSAVITSENFTYFQGEEIRICAESAGGEIEAKSDLPLINTETEGGKKTFTFSASAPGEHQIEFKYGRGRELTTFAKVYVSEDMETVISRRLGFIVEKQQYNEAGNALDGAFLIYDTEEESQYYDEAFSDHNAQRERLGMTILLARYLQTHKNEKFRAALDKALAFVYREVFDSETGEVFNYAQKFSTWLRLYNFPWVALLLTEAFRVVGDKRYLNDAYKIMNAYYERGGKGFYPNGIFVRDIIEEFRKEGMSQEADILQKDFLEHVERIIERGTNYPKHEVNYEQTIVTPAVAFITDAYYLTKDKRYLKAIQEHLAVLERFDGLQPDYMLNNIAVRYWDDYWFGKIHSFGDTLPHYWSSLSSIDYIKYAKAAGDEERMKRGICGLRNCLCLFKEDGSASCARLYPFELNGIRGERFDPWCNDQDFALYFADKYIP